MNKYLLCIGSNTDKANNLKKCRELLVSLYPNIHFSEILETEPVGEGYEDSFLNQLVVIGTNDLKDTVNQNLFKIESELGRLPEDKLRGIVKIDIDLLAVNDDVVKPEDFKRPYISLLLRKMDYSSI